MVSRSYERVPQLLISPSCFDDAFVIYWCLSFGTLWLVSAKLVAFTSAHFLSTTCVLHGLHRITRSALSVVATEPGAEDLESERPLRVDLFPAVGLLHRGVFLGANRISYEADDALADNGSSSGICVAQHSAQLHFPA